MLRFIMHTIVLLMLLAPSAVCAEGVELFAGVGYKLVSWEAITGRTSAIEMDSNGHREFDITLAAGDNFMVGALIDMDEANEDARRIAVQLGLGDWGFYMDKGKVTGSFSTDSDLTFNPTGTDFAYDYAYYGLFDRNGWFGLGYAEWTMPTRAVVNYKENRRSKEVEFVDPETEIQVVGYFLNYNPLYKAIRHNKSGFDMGVNLLVGYTQLTPSDAEVSRVKAITKVTPETSAYSGLGSISTFRLGYFAGTETSNGGGWGIGVGYEVRQYGFLLHFQDSISEENKIFPEYFTLSHGPFIMVAATW